MRTLCCVIAVLCFSTLLPPAYAATTAQPDANLRLVIAVTRAIDKPPTTTLSLLDPQSGAVSEVYRDPKEGRRVLSKIGSSDVIGSAGALPAQDVYAVIGPTVAQSAGGLDAVSFLRIPDIGGAAAWKQVLEIPLCYSEASAYGMWNRAPLLAISTSGNRAAVTALRVGERALYPERVALDHHGAWAPPRGLLSVTKRGPPHVERDQ